MSTKTIEKSKVIMHQLVLPNDTNVLDNVHGGRVMCLMDICAAMSAYKHARKPVVTASVDRLDFLAPAKKGDILLSVRAPVGTTNWAKEECCIGRGLVAIRPKIQSEYVYCFLKSIQIKLSGSGVGSVFNAISKGELCQISLPVPSLQEQEQIVSQIEQGFSLIENSQRIVNSTLQTLEIMRISVLKQVFEGNLVPQDTNDEPASILLEKIKKSQVDLKPKKRRVKNVN